MKKIMFVDEHKIVNYAGGAEKVICNFANEFTKRGYEISIVCMDIEFGCPIYPLDKSVKFINLAYDENGKRTFGGVVWFFKKIQKEFLRTFAGSKMKIAGRHIDDPKKSYFFRMFEKRLRDLIELEKPDLMISNSTDGTGIIQKALNDANIPVIAMCNTDPIHFLSEMTESQKSYWRKCDCVQVLMNRFVEPVKGIGVKRVVRIPNAVIQIEDDKICDLTQTHYRIITAGRIDGSSKRQHLLIEEFIKIASEYPAWSLHIYGNIANRRYKKKLDDMIRKSNLEDRIKFEGVTTHLLDKMREADIFVFPSEYEGFGLALAEAMSVGLPVIGCQECHAVSELIGDKGILCNEQFPISEGLKMLLDRKDLRMSFGKKAHESMKQFKEEKVWELWQTLLDEVLG